MEYLYKKLIKEEKMSNYIKMLPDSPHFTQNGLAGYKYDLETKRLGLYIEVSHKGLDKYVYDKESTHIYYVLEEKGKFSINNEIFDVKEGDVIEAPARIEFTYSGKMKLLLIMTPDFKPENDVDTKKENDLD